MNPRPCLSIVIPTHNGAATLAACLQSLRSSTLPPDEIIVVDDASSDGSAEIARRFQCCVVQVDQNIGAARAKNRGAQVAVGDILFFTDDDVVVSPDALRFVIEDLSNPAVDGVVGLLHSEIPFRDFASNFKNLWMRFTYQRLPSERIGVFYTSVAALRQGVFQRLGGFDENYGGASIAEDTEFGQRVWRCGHSLLLDPRVAVTHCKRYTLFQVLETDFRRARALMLLRLRMWGKPFFTSVPLFYQLAVPVLFLFLAVLALALLFQNLFIMTAGVVLLAGFYVLNASWLGFLGRVRGLPFAIGAALVQPLDVLAVGGGMLSALVEYGFGVRY